MARFYSSHGLPSVLVTAFVAACGGGSKNAGVDALAADASDSAADAQAVDASADAPSDFDVLGDADVRGPVGGTVDSRSSQGDTDFAASDAGQVDGLWHLDPSHPLSAQAPPFAQRSHPLAPTGLWATNLRSPRPTNAFWMNLVLDKGDQRINVVPYHVKALAAGLTVAFPRLDVAESSVTTPDDPQWQMGAVETLGTHQVTSYDDLSVTVTWNASQGSLQSPLVYGMPYASVLFDGLTPNLKGIGVAIVTVNGSASEGSVTADALTVTLNNGQTWRVYSSKPVAWTWSSSEIKASAAFSGWIRLAYQPTDATAALLDRHAAAIPTGGSADLSAVGDVATVRFDWQSTGTGDLLMMAMPHHVARMPSPTTTETMTFSSLGGTLTSVVGSSWTLRYPLSTITWTAPRTVDSGAQSDLQTALQADANFNPDATTDPYFSGKQLAKAARLVLIAREQNLGSLAASLRTKLAAAIQPWLDGSNADALVYDTTWGGIVSSKGLADSAADFGQGYYNDHHFHYGYFVYAAAVLAREDPTWATSHADKMLGLIRDIANPSTADAYFPRIRNFDWFVGHSWAAGLFSFGDGRNQESTSEAVNAWYAVELFGRARQDETLTNLGRILRAMEVASAQAYWQVPDASAIYAAPFKGNHAVGILWQTKADFTTFFGTNPAYIYGIQMMPFTPATEDLVARAWIADAATQMAAAAASATSDGWKGFMTMAKAVIDPTTAWTEARQLGSYDDGNSQTNTLYWIATRPK